MKNLPTTIPIFPLKNALLLPGRQLPLNIFETRYLSMVSNALKTDKIIGMIQPTEKKDLKHKNNGEEVYEIGCAGKIVSSNQTPDNRYEIILQGVSRFSILKELEKVSGYRRVKVNWKNFKSDLKKGSQAFIDRSLLKNVLGDFAKKHSVQLDWEGLDKMKDQDIIGALISFYPFQSNEKQAILESKNEKEQAKTIISLMQINNFSYQENNLKAS
tara:strand:+ start:177 stop:821 length:645 start_codon:yes stop_codon:yes gene_type:complete